MIDLETMGTNSYAAIISIGAVKFGIEEGIIDKFYQVVDLRSSMRSGLKVDGDTILWWMKQEENSRFEFIKDNKPLIEVLILFSSWIKNTNSKIWGNGSDFDNVILANSYHSCNLELPWSHSNNRCYRTIKNTFKSLKYETFGTKHKSVDDAESQALHLIKICKFYNLKL